MDAAGLKPDDVHNQALRANVHPEDWINPEPAVKYNLVVVGAGTAGLISAIGTAGLGGKVALVEENLMGGDCLNAGCVPSKTLIRSGRAMAEIVRSHNLGLVPGPAEVDFGAVMARVRSVRTRISANDSVAKCTEAGVDVFLGRGVFTGTHRVEVGDAILNFDKAVIATGARPSIPPIEGLKTVDYLINETIFNITEKPESLAIIGPGPIGCELAQAFQRLGVQVHLISRGSVILPKDDPEAAAIVADSLKKDGVDLVFNASYQRIEERSGAKVVVMEIQGQEKEITTSHLLVATGRTPNVEGMGLEKAGVRYNNREGVKVDERLRTTNPDIYAAGDVCSALKFTHMAEATAKIVIQNALFAGRRRVSQLTVPWCTFTDPEVAQIGLTEAMARQKSIAIDTFKIEMSEIDRALADGQEEGFVKIHLARGTDTIVGATICSAHAGEIIGQLGVAMAGGVGLKILAGVIQPYPTQALAIKQVATIYNKTRLTPRVARFLNMWLKRKR